MLYLRPRADCFRREHPGQPKKFEDENLETLFDEDRCLVQKAENWLPHELSERQLEKRRTICEWLLERCEKKSLLYRIVTGD